MSMRIVKSARRTDETEISLTLNLDGSGIYDVDTGIRWTPAAVF